MKPGLTYFKEIDLRGTPCPVNFIRCRLILDSLEPGQNLYVYLDRGDPEVMVINGLKDAGHRVDIISQEKTWLSLLVSNASK